MIGDAYTFRLLGNTLKELAPLIEEAMRVLDKPGTRVLRRKIDGKFHFAVGVYGTHAAHERARSELAPHRIAPLPARDAGRLIRSIGASCVGRVVVRRPSPDRR